MAIFNTVSSALQSGASKAGIDLKSIASGFGLVNNTQNASNYDEPSRSTNMTFENIQDLMNVRRSIVTNQDEIRYPPDINSRYMTFSFYEYKRPNPLKQGERIFRNKITLPLPAHQLAENHDPVIEQQSLGVFGSYMNALEAGGEGLLGAVGTSALNVINNIDPQRKSLIGQLTGASGPNVTGYLQQKLGAAPNPHPTFFFKGVTPRFHTFTWALAPRNAEESDLIRRVVTTFRNNMLPAKLYSGNFLTYPYICDIAIVPDDYYYKFKTCFVDFFRASYSPHVFAKTKAPTGVNITITFQEIEIMLSDREASDTEKKLENNKYLNKAIGAYQKQLEQVTDSYNFVRNEGVAELLPEINNLPRIGPAR